MVVMGAVARAMPPWPGRCRRGQGDAYAEYADDRGGGGDTGGRVEGRDEEGADAACDEAGDQDEAGVVIGRRCRHVAAEDARSVIAGYLVANDVSVRDWLAKRSPTFTLGKSFDTHGPIGPWLTTDDEIADPHALRMRLSVNGEVRQDSSTNDMIYDIYEQIAYLSQVMTLMPGDILATGTPAGIGAPIGRFLRTGDVVRAEIEGLGMIENHVVAAP
ncbi:fumarylacetoacetate hydrolase family protein [Streptomyces sp. SID3915]|uniref:fumarylacetoacetate hydrolase family protein n=1 Tax=Streptomyces sp. SID3915 TaxID=2690263 RepID=UPI001F168B62|nr:fumarylacetoacetate hydrolase family protein [Streptomyces sp. SID3915]